MLPHFGSFRNVTLRHGDAGSDELFHYTPPMSPFLLTPPQLSQQDQRDVTDPRLASLLGSVCNLRLCVDILSQRGVVLITSEVRMFLFCLPYFVV